MNKNDRRVRRTRGMLQEALLHLIVEKGYDDITVQDIIDRADVGRSTFYFHFMDKEDLLEWSINQLRAYIEMQQKGVQPVVKNSGEIQLGTSMAMLDHAKDHKELYQAVTGRQSGAVILHYFKGMLRDLFEDEMGTVLTRATPSLKIPHSLAVDFVVNTFWTVLTWWMDNDIPCSVAEADKTFLQLVHSGMYGD